MVKSKLLVFVYQRKSNEKNLLYCELFTDIQNYRDFIKLNKDDIKFLMLERKDVRLILEV